MPNGIAAHGPERSFASSAADDGFDAHTRRSSCARPEPTSSQASPQTVDAKLAENRIHVAFLNGRVQLRILAVTCQKVAVLCVLAGF